MHRRRGARRPREVVGETLADPLEGTAYGRGKAKVLRRDNGSLLIHSFAHGGIKYDLPTPMVLIEPLIADLARLDRVAYDRRRKQAAKDLGVRPSTLDEMVEESRAEQAEDAEAGALLPHWVVEPWPEPVDTGILLGTVQARITQHVATLGKRAIVPALWTMFSWVHDTATHSPILLVTSPERDSGKTTLVGLLGYMTPRPLANIDISSAAL
jgi:hypothetical protein